MGSRDGHVVDRGEAGVEVEFCSHSVSFVLSPMATRGIGEEHEPNLRRELVEDGNMADAGVHACTLRQQHQNQT